MHYGIKEISFKFYFRQSSFLEQKKQESICQLTHSLPLLQRMQQQIQFWDIENDLFLLFSKLQQGYPTWNGNLQQDSFFVGWAISRCLSTTPHPINRARGWYTSCSLLYGHTFTSHFCILMAVVRYNHIPIYTCLTKSECIPARINLEIIMVKTWEIKKIRMVVRPFSMVKATITVDPIPAVWPDLMKFRHFCQR